MLIIHFMDESDLVQVTIENISLSNLGFVVFLRRHDIDKVLPIFIGAPEAHSIAAAYNNHKFPRPLTHDLFRNVLELLDCTVMRVIITGIAENTFFSKIYLRRKDENFQIDSRPSDSLALALRFKAPIFVQKSVMEAASIDMKSEESPDKLDAVQQLKDELDQAVLEERYEDAAKIRDELKKLQNDN